MIPFSPASSASTCLSPDLAGTGRWCWGGNGQGWLRSEEEGPGSGAGSSWDQKMLQYLWSLEAIDPSFCFAATVLLLYCKIHVVYSELAWTGIKFNLMVVVLFMYLNGPVTENPFIELLSTLPRRFIWSQVNDRLHIFSGKWKGLTNS
jgi:hypothetical protein